MLLPVQVNSPDRTENNPHDPVFCSQVNNTPSGNVNRININPNDGSINVTLQNGTVGPLDVCPGATFNPAPPLVRSYNIMYNIIHVWLIIIIIYYPIVIKLKSFPFPPSSPAVMDIYTWWFDYLHNRETFSIYSQSF